MDSTTTDAASIVGDECHIISGQVNGPRYDASFDRALIDACENLILLCRTHHKMVDDQSATYTADILRQMKRNHEVWVAQQLDGPKTPQPLKYRRVPENIPQYLSQLTSGEQILDLTERSYAFYIGNDELQSDNEVSLVGDFVQTIRDWGDVGTDMEPSDRIRVAFELTKELRALETNGFSVFGAREMQYLEGGTQEAASNWPVAHIRVIRNDSKEIIKTPVKD